MNFFKNISVIAMLCSIGCMLPKATASRGGKAAPAQQRVATPKAGAAGRTTGRQSAGKQGPVVQQKSYDQILKLIKTVKPTAQDYALLADIQAEIDRQMTLLRPKIRQPEPVLKPALPPRIIEQPRPQIIVPVQPIIQPIVQPILPPRIEQIKPQIIAPIQQIVKKVGIETYLVPTDANELKRLDLCPLFGRKAAALSQDEQALAKDLRQQGYSEEDIAEFISSGVTPHYSVFREKRGQLEPSFGTVNVAMNVPCAVQLGKYGNWNRALMQLKTLDQFELAQKENLSAAMCGGLSLNNGRLIRKYALTSGLDWLSKLHDIKDAANFLRKIALNDWINVEIARDAIGRYPVELGTDGIDMSAVSTVVLFDSSLVDRPQELSLFDQAEFYYVQNVKRRIQEGLTRDNYVHAIVIGNIEAVQQHGHYFCFAIIKKGNEIQYIALDTIPSAYHLQEGSHERNRLMFVIENIERGSSLIKVPNLYAQPEFMGAAKLSKENELEVLLGRERMEEGEGSAFDDQIKLLNIFSKKLVSARSIDEGLSKESKQSLNGYLLAIKAIDGGLGAETAYPELRKLIQKRLLNFNRLL